MKKYATIVVFVLSVTAQDMHRAARYKKKIVTIGFKNLSFGVAAVEESAITWVRINHIAPNKKHQDGL